MTGLDKVAARKRILGAVLKKHDLDPEEFFSTRKSDALVEARRDAALQLFAAGFSLMRIAQILKRTRTTIKYYLSPETKGPKRQRTRTWKLLHMLPNEDRETIERLAAERNVSPYHLTRSWLVERAQFETGQARSAA